MGGLKKRVVVVRQPAECWLCIQDGQDAVAGSVEKVWEHDRRPIAEVRMLWPVPESDKFRGKSTRLTIVSQKFCSSEMRRNLDSGVVNAWSYVARLSIRNRLKVSYS